MQPEGQQAGWRTAALVIFLYYPVMVVKWLPFGGGDRYLSVLAAPLALLLLLQAPRGEARALLRAAWRWSWPLLPLALAWTAAQLWHRYDPPDFNPLTHVLWGGLLYIGARLVGVTRRHLAWTAALAALVYLAVGLWEVLAAGRARAWGGTYENRFGQFAVWMVALCGLHGLAGDAPAAGKWRLLLVVAGGAGIVAAILSGSRGALLALLALAVMAAFRELGWRRGAVGAVLLAAPVVAAGMLFEPLRERMAIVSGELAAYFSEPVLTPTSIGLRLELVRIAGVMLLEHPFFGPGSTVLEVLYKQHPSLGVPHELMLGLPGFHSDFGQMIGLGGGVLLAGWLATCLWMLACARGDVFRQSCVVLALIFGISEIYFANNLGLSLLTASWALYSAAGDHSEENHEGDQEIPLPAG